MYEGLDELVKIKAEADALLKSKGEAAFKAAVTELFATEPTVDAIRWTQYTPYFNDGDPCYFSVNELEYQGGYGGSEFYRDDGWKGLVHSDWTWRDHHTYVKSPDAVLDLNTKLQSLEDVLERLFGDHAEITITRDGTITVDEHSHD